MMLTYFAGYIQQALLNTAGGNYLVIHFDPMQPTIRMPSLGTNCSMYILIFTSKMSQRTEIFLPTEIIIRIVTFVAADGSQLCLHACCLVSRQWYSASVALLYAEPDFQHAFEKFTATVCPPIATSRSKTDPGLGSLVRILDMSPLVYHSTNSVTARLLGRVKENLEVFIAPMISFS